MDRVSQTWEAKKSQMIACELTMFEANITQIRNNMKQICLAQNKVKETELQKLHQQITVLRTQQHQREEKVEEL